MRVTVNTNETDKTDRNKRIAQLHSTEEQLIETLRHFSFSGQVTNQREIYELHKEKNVLSPLHH